MRRRPRPAKDGIFAGGMGFDIAYQGVLISVLVLAAYFVGHYIETGVWTITDSADGTTMAFLTMSMAEVCHSFNMRSLRGCIFTMGTKNKALVWGCRRQHCRDHACLRGAVPGRGIRLHAGIVCRIRHCNGHRHARHGHR